MQMREGEAPSYYNPFEAEQLVTLVTGLLSQHARTGAVTAADIGVICTYRKQVSGLPHPGCICRMIVWSAFLFVSTLPAQCAGHPSRILGGSLEVSKDACEHA